SGDSFLDVANITVKIFGAKTRKTFSLRNILRMGICISSSHDENSVPTANLILMDGSIREFSQPLRNNEILREYPGHFICSSDGLYIGKNISEVLHEDDQLQLGQLYFLLPRRKLEYVVTESDMAALFLKANSAIKQRKRNNKRVQPLFHVDLDARHDEGLTSQDISSWGEEEFCGINLCMSKTMPVSPGRVGLGKTQWQSKLETIVESV
ncbi:hypothetical protein KI387_025381, partial [Taxus chinensis]